MAILYTTNCPQCEVLKKKLDAKGIPYTINDSVKEMLELCIQSVPVLKVDDKMMNFSEANAWINAQ